MCELDLCVMTNPATAEQEFQLSCRQCGRREIAEVDLASLSFNDLQRLRAAVRRVHMQYYPADFCTNREADRIIETIGEQTAQRLLKRLVDGKMADGKLAR